ncbi:guanylate cyclase soluble subunit beta-1-like isoform X2 [Paramacrobiotus metropolitanus]|uniref:guanylate cyclase soluble subunit beta-1-like isoform X2 n=1 Tax=Paramacrobiotus metropolitanus TaxID=2943436 RepID=UPI0024464C69|nr:guanylate cyclase soluble subunit beta-1-like isoform X2 [Paramacrobiotus metropolitanus]
MHGITVRAVELLVCQKFGEDAWERMKVAAGLKISGNFLVTEYYSDIVTYRLVDAAEEILGVSSEQFWEVLGEYFFDYVVEYGYSRLLSVLGETPVEFLENLDTLHCALGRVYPIRPPLFRCETRKNGMYLLHYYSKRRNMEYYMMGLLRRTLDVLYKTKIELVLLEKNEHEDHCTFSISFSKTGSPNPGSIQEAVSAPLQPPDSLMPSARISPSTFAALCPFYLIFTRDLVIKECGRSILLALPALVDAAHRLDQTARLVRPWLPLTFNNIVEHQNSVFLLDFDCQTAGGVKERSLKLNGQMLYLPANDTMLFISSPYITSLEDLSAKGYSLSDVPLHDAKREFILASENFALEHKIISQLEDLTQRLQQTTKQVQDEKKKTDKLIYAILPPAVAQSLRSGSSVNSQRYDSVTILFSGVVDFDKFCLSKTGQTGAMEVVRLLNQLYTEFDALLDTKNNPNLYKVETVMDKYMVVSGAPNVLPPSAHAEEIVLLAMKMRRCLRGLTIDSKGTTVRVTIGIHSGEIVTGVIGNRMPRYCLFGDTVNMASRFQTTGKEGMINISQETVKCMSGRWFWPFGIRSIRSCWQSLLKRKEGARKTMDPP